jgi:hypothetical protein
VYALYCDFCGHSTAYLDLCLNNAQVRRFFKAVDNAREDFLTGSYLISVGAGSHTIDLRGLKNGPDVRFGCGACSNMVIEVIPE